MWTVVQSTSQSANLFSHNLSIALCSSFSTICERLTRYSREILSNVDNTSSERCNFSAAIFSRKCATEDVPGISKIFGERCNSHASATCIGVALRFAATSESVEDCSGVKPPSGKNGTYAMPSRAKASIIASSARCAMLYSFCTQTISAILRASATCVGVTLLRPICFTSLVVASPPARSGWLQSILPLGHDHRQT